MKISSAFSLFQLATAGPMNLMGGKLTETVSRRMQGDWVNEFFPRHRRDAVDGAKGFKPLAAMILYMQGFNGDSSDPQSHNNFDNKLQSLEDTYTNYGCYCWIDGVDKGVVGGGRPRDMSDHHCKELYRCYKCVNVDYAQNYTDVSYNVDFTMDNGNRELDCTVNSKQDAENICECDKRFAENIASVEKACDNGDADDEKYGSQCMSEQFRTKTGNVLGTNDAGTFNPHDIQNCEKNMHGHNKENCCGIYPNRYPYDVNFNECCQETLFDGSNSGSTVTTFELLSTNICEQRGGSVVFSDAGNPHSYSSVNPNASG